MKRAALLAAAAAVILTGVTVSPLEAQSGFHGRGLRHAHHRGLRLGAANNLSTGGYTTLFDLYRTGQIPIPPYFSLHPPVYYSGNTYQTYGGTPFAFPYNWWQQYGYGSPFGNSGYVSPGNVTSAYAPPSPKVVHNHYLVQNTDASDPPGTLATAERPQPKVIYNPFVDRQGNARLAGAE